MSAVNVEFNEDYTQCYISIKDLNMMHTLNDNPDLFSEFNKSFLKRFYLLSYYSIP